MLRFLLSIGNILVGKDVLRASYRSLVFGETNQLGLVGLFAKAVLWPLTKIRRFNEFVEAGAREQRNTKINYSLLSGQFANKFNWLFSISVSQL
jgi:hypothetical protein